MSGLAVSGAEHPYRRYSFSAPRQTVRRRFIVRPWSAEKGDVPVYERRGNKRVKLAPEDCVVIVNRAGDCYYAARSWFESEPLDTDAWASAAWRFLSKRQSGEARR